MYLVPTEDCILDEPETHDNCQQSTVGDFNKEVKYAVMASELDIGPKVYSSWICDNVESPLHEQLTKKKEIKMGFILMEKMQYTLNEYIYKFRKLFKKNIGTILIMYKNLVEKMLNGNILNMDLNLNNIMLDINDENIPIKLRIIDWGFSRPLKQEGEEEEFTVDKLSTEFIKKLR